jgi:hypothetical protein
MNLDLTDKETAALLRELDGRYFLSQRIKTLKASSRSRAADPSVANLQWQTVCE